MVEHATFDVGSIVHHVRYKYRGVILKVDRTCQANEAWYKKNRTQPKREQPWYQVLVEGGNETYVAQSNLEPDTEGSPVEHPAIANFFPTFLNGKYYRQSLN